MAAVLHRKPPCAGMSCYSVQPQGHNKREISLRPLSVCTMDGVVVASLSPQRPRFKCIPGHVQFVVDIVALG
jgi:hypothetical protein